MIKYIDAKSNTFEKHIFRFSVLVKHKLKLEINNVI